MMRVNTARGRVTSSRKSFTYILYEMHNACQKMVCCMECMPKDGMLYGMHVKRWHAVRNTCQKTACCIEYKLNNCILYRMLSFIVQRE